ncbi:hypothetical protein F11_13265 [Rhodospirillum rubrum F11]|nr:hypothetical protein F11_13265 [Rhodospirillum rubrum F11]MBK5955025.1 hypothetical protein [Rhodospirillum rubrum]
MPADDESSADPVGALVQMTVRSASAPAAGSAVVRPGGASWSANWSENLDEAGRFLLAPPQRGVR